LTLSNSQTVYGGDVVISELSISDAHVINDNEKIKASDPLKIAPEEFIQLSNQHNLTVIGEKKLKKSSVFVLNRVKL